MTSLSSKEIAYSNFIQVIRSKTAMGFVPNYSAGGTKSIDRTEPPIGAKVMLEMYNKFKDEWIVELLFDDLLAWNVSHTSTLIHSRDRTTPRDELL